MKIKITGTYTVPILVTEIVRASFREDDQFKKEYRPYKCSVDLNMEIDDKDIKSLLANQKSLFQHVFGDK